jgi:cytidine deaminase
MVNRRTRSVFELDYSRNGDDELYDPLVLVFEMGPTMIDQARAIRRKEAVSHREVKVGAWALVNNEAEKKVRGYVGYNYSPLKGIQKHCAEMRAFGRGLSNGYSRRDAVIVVGEKDPEIIKSVSSVEWPTMHTCDPCTDLDGLRMRRAQTAVDILRAA